MKRRYKAGDWLRVPLGGEWSALAIITRACRSRLFGYFFTYPAAQAPAHEELRALTAHGAVAAMLFGGAPIEHGRWPLVAASLAFDEGAWPFPDFVSRGAFGEAWTRVRYDSQTLQIVERLPIDEQQARAMPDARFAGAHEVEDLLRSRIAGRAMPRAQSVCEIRSPLDPARLRALEEGGRIQFSTPLRAPDVDVLRSFIQAHPGVGLRVHGFRRGFDATLLASLVPLRDLAIDVHHVQHPQTLTALQSLRSLRIGATHIDLEFLSFLPEVHTLELRSTRASLAPLERCTALRRLYLENTQPIDFTAIPSASRLRELTLAHGDYAVGSLAALRELRSLELRSLDAAELPPFEQLQNLRRLVLRDMRALVDLAPLTRALSLRELEISGMPQLNVNDFEPLAACRFHDVRIDVGSRRKEREIYRLLRFGNT